MEVVFMGFMGFYRKWKGITWNVGGYSGIWNQQLSLWVCLKIGYTHQTRCFNANHDDSLVNLGVQYIFRQNHMALFAHRLTYQNHLMVRKVFFPINTHSIKTGNWNALCLDKPEYKEVGPGFKVSQTPFPANERRSAPLAKCSTFR